jgi:hypothetical protein
MKKHTWLTPTQIFSFECVSECVCVCVRMLCFFHEWIKDKKKVPNSPPHQFYNIHNNQPLHQFYNIHNNNQPLFDIQEEKEEELWSLDDDERRKVEANKELKKRRMDMISLACERMEMELPPFSWFLFWTLPNPPNLINVPTKKKGEKEKKNHNVEIWNFFFYIKK